MAKIDVTFLQREIEALKTTFNEQTKSIGAQIAQGVIPPLGDSDTGSEDTAGMSTNDNEQFASQVAKLEERMDARVKGIQDSISASSSSYRHELDLRDAGLRRELSMKEKHFRREHKIYSKALDDHLDRIEGSVGSAVKEIKDFKIWMAGIGVAVVLAIMGANYTLIGSAQGIFDGGKANLVNQQRVETLIQESKTQAEDNRKLLDEIKSRAVQPK